MNNFILDQKSNLTIVIIWIDVIRFLELPIPSLLFITFII